VTEERTTVIRPAPTARNTTTIERRDIAPGATTTTTQQTETTPPPGTSTTTVEHTVTAGDPHQAWWRTYHGTEPYDYSRAEAAHRIFCDNNPSDTSCAGWYVRQ
jgi:hypothetical protein